MSHYAMVTFDLLGVADDACDRFKSQLAASGWSGDRTHANTTLLRRFSDEYSVAECVRIAQRSLSKAGEEAQLHGELRFVICVSPLEPIASNWVFGETPPRDEEIFE